MSVTTQSSSLSTINPGTVIATENIAGTEYQIVKVAQGISGSVTDVSSAAPLPVRLDYSGANSTPFSVTLTSGALPLGSVVLTSGSQTIGTVLLASESIVIGSVSPSSIWTVSNSSGTQQIGTVALTSGSLTLGTVNAILSSGTLSLGTVTLSSGAQQIGTVALTSGALTLGTVNAAQSGAWTVSNSSGSQTIGTVAVSSGAVLISSGTQQIGTVALTSGALSLGTVVNSSGTQTIGTVIAAGDLASGSSAVSNPLAIGGIGHTANPAAVTDGQRVNATFDKLGKQVVVGAIRDLKAALTTSTSTTAETAVVTAGSSLQFVDLYVLLIRNLAATGTDVSIRDSSGGSVVGNIYVPATETRGFSVSVDSAWPQTTAGKSWTTVQTSSLAQLQITTLAVKNI